MKNLFADKGTAMLLPMSHDEAHVDIYRVAQKKSGPHGIL